ncbi:MAG TPA: sialidase, partial [Planctomycetaceae bacterium]|nr:sialidase [Planctomycetaceae bacterium]
MIQRTMLILLLCGATTAAAGDDDVTWNKLKPFFEPPAEFAGQFGAYHSPLKFYDGTPAKDGSDWLRRRQEILDRWNGLLGKWPELIEHPQIERLESMHRDNFTQHRIRVEVARGQILDGYLLVPDGTGPFPAVVVPFYEPETSIGTKGERRDFALQLS